MVCESGEMERHGQAITRVAAHSHVPGTINTCLNHSLMNELGEICRSSTIMLHV